MMRFPMGFFRRAVAAAILFGVLIGICALPVRASVCEEALRICLFEDQEIRMNLLAFYVVFCLEGYAFCKKYIDPSNG
jgi:hypothetical protein